jgi:hypothetical protein
MCRNAGGPAVTEDFLAWGIETYPAERVCAVLGNHGNGIDEKGARGGSRARPHRPLGRMRKAFGHKGPYVPLLLEARQEDELACEYADGTVAQGAFSFFLAQTVCSFAAGKRPLTVSRLIAETAKQVEARYKQTPRLEGPKSRRSQRLV